MDNLKGSFDAYIEEAFATLTQQLVELKCSSVSHKEFIDQIKDNFSEVQLSIFDDITIRHKLHTLITISSLDLLATLKLYKSSTLLWERIFLIKKGYLIIYETILAFEKGQKKIRDLVILNCEDGKNQLYNEINTELKKYKKTFNIENIGNIRNKVSGHIDDNFDNYYDIVMGINPDEAIKAIQALIAILNKCDIFLNELRQVSNSKLEMNRQRFKEEIDIKMTELNELINKQKK